MCIDVSLQIQIRMQHEESSTQVLYFQKFECALIVEACFKTKVTIDQDWPKIGKQCQSSKDLCKSVTICLLFFQFLPSDFVFALQTKGLGNFLHAKNIQNRFLSCTIVRRSSFGTAADRQGLQETGWAQCPTDKSQHFTWDAALRTLDALNPLAFVHGLKGDLFDAASKFRSCWSKRFLSSSCRTNCTPCNQVRT